MARLKRGSKKQLGIRPKHNKQKTKRRDSQLTRHQHKQSEYEKNILYL